MDDRPSPEIEAKLNRLCAERDYYKAVLIEIANEDYRGNRSPASEKAHHALTRGGPDELNVGQGHGTR